MQIHRVALRSIKQRLGTLTLDILVLTDILHDVIQLNLVAVLPFHFLEADFGKLLDEVVSIQVEHLDVGEALDAGLAAADALEELFVAEVVALFEVADFVLDGFGSALDLPGLSVDWEFHIGLLLYHRLNDQLSIPHNVESLSLLSNIVDQLILLGRVLLQIVLVEVQDLRFGPVVEQVGHKLD